MTTMANLSDVGCNVQTAARLAKTTAITVATLCDCVTVVRRSESVVVVSDTFPTSVLLMLFKTLVRFLAYLLRSLV